MTAALAVGVVGLIAAFAIPAGAMAMQVRSSAATSSAEVTSTTNPEGWQRTWGDTLYPRFVVTGVEDAVGGSFYVIDRAPATVLATDTVSLSTYSRALLPSGTQFSQTLDVAGAFAFPPVGGWPAPPVGATDPREGRWYWHFLPFSLDTSSGLLVFDPQVDVPFGIDLTPPGPVLGVAVTPSVSEPATSVAVGAGSRVALQWQGSEYDSLSGTAFFSVYLDGVRAISGGAIAPIETPPGQPPMWYDPAWPLPYRVSIEDLAPGRHTFVVTATDRATNEGASGASAIYYSDPDTPPTTWSPSPTTPVNARQSAAFSVTAVDSCLRDVTFLLDGISIGVEPADASVTGTQTLSVSKALGSYSNGSHTVTAIAHDRYGRAATITAGFVLDRTPPVFTNLSLPLYNDEFTKSTFYPMRHDGYWDTSSLHYRVSEKSKVTLEVHEASAGGAVLRTFTANRTGAGTGVFTWDGRSSTGALSTGTFYYVLRAVDAAGNVSVTWSHVVRIKSYQVVRISKSRVKVIRR